MKPNYLVTFKYNDPFFGTREIEHTQVYSDCVDNAIALAKATFRFSDSYIYATYTTRLC